MTYTVWSLSEITHLLKDGQGSKSLTDFADELGVSKQYLSNVLNGNSPPSNRLLANFGYTRTAAYVPLPKKEKRKMTTATATLIGCAHCDREFPTDEELMKHASKEHGDKLRRPNKTASTITKTLVNVILDKSGSMQTKVADVIGGFNTYIAELKKDTGSEYIFTLTLFDTDFSEMYLAEPLEKIQDLNTGTYQPGGGTALNDAIGRTIKLIDGDSRNADKIITVIMTDGEENSSHEYSTEAVKALIEAKEKQGWAFIFLGASLNAFQQGAGYGIHASNVARYDANNYRETYAAVGHATASASAGAAPMHSCFAATPDSMLRCANLQIDTTGPITSFPPSMTVTTNPTPKGINRKGWNPRNKR